MEKRTRGGSRRLARAARVRLELMRARSRLRQSMIPIPCAYLVVAIVLGILSPKIDSLVGSHVNPSVGTGAARDVLTSTATGMIAFTGFVVSAVLLVVQFAAGQYSARLVLWFRRDQLVKHAIGSFLAAPLFALVALREIDLETSPYSPDITVVISLALLVGAAVLFLALLQRTLDELRPRSLFERVVRQGVRAARDTYPVRLDPAVDGQTPPPNPGWQAREPRELLLSGRPGVLASFDRNLLLAAATVAGVTIELVPGVGEYISHRQVLLRVHGHGPVDDELLRRAVVVSEERTIEQDPAFALRAIVDTGIRALSAAINDPTTAVHSLDSIEVLVRELATRDLESPLTLDERGEVRVVWRAPSWRDLVELAFAEIRMYGVGSIQVCRRLRAVLEDLCSTTPILRHPALEEQLEQLEASLQREFVSDSAELATAQSADRTGLGLGRVT
ncbi:MAG: DUF2254 domain-containing protein [Solirubrobacterales bacterium]|nr:DUF2254 domain-containing protein [Solirubrobacterales bacterium]